MTLSLEEAVAQLVPPHLEPKDPQHGDMAKAFYEVMRSTARETLRAYARHIVEKAAPKDGFNTGTSDYHSRLLEEISK